MTVDPFGLFPPVPGPERPEDKVGPPVSAKLGCHLDRATEDNSSLGVATERSGHCCETQAQRACSSSNPDSTFGSLSKQGCHEANRKYQDSIRRRLWSDRPRGGCKSQAVWRVSRYKF